jgi:hypothetical protein
VRSSWVSNDVCGLSNRELAAYLTELGIDVLVDLIASSAGWAYSCTGRRAPLSVGLVCLPPAGSLATTSSSVMRWLSRPWRSASTASAGCPRLKADYARDASSATCWDARSAQGRFRVRQRVLVPRIGTRISNGEPDARVEPGTCTNARDRSSMLTSLTPQERTSIGRGATNRSAGRVWWPSVTRRRTGNSGQRRQRRRQRRSLRGPLN